MTYDHDDDPLPDSLPTPTPAGPHLIPLAHRSLKAAIRHACKKAEKEASPVKALQIADQLIAKVVTITSFGQPSLGLATTAELRAELETRERLGRGDPNYRTAD